METRKTYVFSFVIDEKENENLEFRKQEPLDLEKARQILDFKFIIGRYLTLKPETTGRSVINTVLVQITEEIYEACQEMNIVHYKGKKKHQENCGEHCPRLRNTVY